MGQAVGEIHFNVFLVAPQNVLAGAAWSRTWEIHDWFDSGGPASADLSGRGKRLTVQKRTAFAERAP